MLISKKALQNMSYLCEKIGKNRAKYWPKKCRFMAQKLALKFALWYNECVNCFCCCARVIIWQK